MSKMVLFLLKPGFTDDKGGPWFCPGCAGVEGFLKFAPEVERQIEVRRIDFPRPRKEIVELVGAGNQGCPVLVLAKGATAPPEAKTQPRDRPGVHRGPRPDLRVPGPHLRRGPTSPLTAW